MAATEDTRCITAISRIADGRRRWRVAAEIWTAGESFEGRLVFVSDDEPDLPALETPTLFRGDSREDVLRAAHEVPEDRLHALLRSLS